MISLYHCTIYMNLHNSYIRLNPIQGSDSSKQSTTTEHISRLQKHTLPNSVIRMLTLYQNASIVLSDTMRMSMVQFFSVHQIFMITNEKKQNKVQFSIIHLFSCQYKAKNQHLLKSSRLYGVLPFVYLKH